MKDFMTGGIWVMAAINVKGEISKETLELFGEAVRLCNGQLPVTAIAGGNCAQECVAALGRAGADQLIVINDAVFDWLCEETQAQTLCRLIKKYQPQIILGSSDAAGRALLSRTASLCHVGLTADCTKLSLEEGTGALLQTRPAFGGNLLATIRSDRQLPQMVTVRSGVMKPLTDPKIALPKVVHESVDDGERSDGKQLLKLIIDHSCHHDLEAAQVILAGGRGLGRDGFALLRQLAELTGATVGASRAAVDVNWASYLHQVGQTGRTVRPKLYLAFGISGQIQHLVGMQQSDVIVAVNRDPAAPIMQMADLAVTGDAKTILQQLIGQHSEVKS